MDARTIRIMLKDATAQGKNLYMDNLKLGYWQRIIGARQLGDKTMIRHSNGTWREATGLTFDIR